MGTYIFIKANLVGHTQVSMFVYMCYINVHAIFLYGQVWNKLCSSSVDTHTIEQS